MVWRQVFFVFIFCRLDKAKARRRLRSFGVNPVLGFPLASLPSLEAISLVDNVIINLTLDRFKAIVKHEI